MEIRETLQQTLQFSGKKKVSSWMIYLLAAFGALLVAASAWIYFNDINSKRAAESISTGGGQAMEQLNGPVNAIKAVLADEEVQALALQVLETPARQEDLLALARQRQAAISSVAVFAVDDVNQLLPSTLGANGYALMDMILSVIEGKMALMQVHNVLQPPVMFDAAPLQSEGETIGVLIVGFDPAFLLQAFEPEVSSLGYIRVSQSNGRQPASILFERGDPGRAGEVPDRAVVPGTRLRVEYPQARYISAAGGMTLLLTVLAGLACIAAAWGLHRGNRKWARERRLEAAEAASASAAPRDTQPILRPVEPEPDRDATFAEHASTDDQPAVEPPVDPTGEKPAETAPPPMHLHYDLNERLRQRESEHEPVELTPEIFRAYDIRGIIDKTLDSGIARSVGRAIGSLALEREASPVVVARDGRLSGPYLMEGMIEGITSAGCDVLDVGAVPTGVLYFAAFELGSGSGVMITGSHNPPDYNGFKVMVDGDTLYGEDIKGLYERIEAGDLASGEGKVVRRNVVPAYIERISGDIELEKPLRVVIDCGNGIGGVCAAETLRAIGAEVLPLFDEVDGTFPNHHPDPSDPENLKDLIESVRLMDADLGLAFDGDADRLGVVTLAGSIIYADRVMMLLALDVLDRNPGATILYDVKCTGHLPRVIREAGGDPVMYKTGHSLMKAKMKELGAPFAGEMSGHFFFKERWYGVDDGIYAAARLLEILAGTETPPEAILSALPSSYSTPELKVEMEEGENHEFVEAFKAAAGFEGAEINTIDGLRADFEDGWGLVRASNTTPVLIVRFDAETEEALERIKNDFRERMLKLKPDLDLPF